MGAAEYSKGYIMPAVIFCKSLLRNVDIRASATEASEILKLLLRSGFPAVNYCVLVSLVMTLCNEEAATNVSEEYTCPFSSKKICI